MQHITPIVFEPFPGYVIDQEKAVLALERFIGSYGRDTPVSGLFAISQIHTLLSSKGEEIGDDIRLFLDLMANILNDIHEAAIQAENQQIANLKAELEISKSNCFRLLPIKGMGVREKKPFFPKDN